MSVHEHNQQAGHGPVHAHIRVASTTRDLAQDRSGLLIAERLTAAGHLVGSREVVDDDELQIRAAIAGLAAQDAQVVLVTGGTGLAPRDVTPEALAPLFTRRIDGFGELFRSLSYAEIGAAAMLSRACAGVVGRTLVFAMPGSTKACALAMDKLVLPELRHLVHLIRP